jgi:hypothetical protein
MYKSAVNDNAEDFPKVAVAVDAYPTIVIWVKFVSNLIHLSLSLSLSLSVPLSYIYISLCTSLSLPSFPLSPQTTLL